MAEPKAGDRVGEYVLVEQLGAGSFGQVWKANHHIWTDQLVAVKIATDPQYVRNLRSEGVAVHGLKHPNIVRAIGMDPYADPPYLTTELVEGVSLRHLIDSNPTGLPVDTVVAIFEGLLLALQEAHANNLIHRDIKPANILIQHGQEISDITAGSVRVTDFGLGRAQDLTTASIMQSGSMLTEQGKSISGTLAYMAPEQLEGGPADIRSDIFSCGVVLFEMLTAKRPQGRELPSQIRKDVPGWLDETFARCYTRLEDRYSSAEQVLSALQRREPPPVPAGRSVPPPPPPPIRRPLTHCPQCKRKVEPGDNFCIWCGYQLTANPHRCPNCGAYPEPGDRFCISCGQSLTRVD